MTVLTTRGDFEKLLELRLREVKLLIDHQEWDGAYYLAGYVVEFALKIRIISRLMKSEIFPDRKLSDSFYKHDLERLLQAADLEDEMESDSSVEAQWTIVKDWSEQSRYEIGTTEKEARELYDAIEKEVLPWIKARW